MRDLDRLLDSIKESRSLASDNALAKLLGTGRATISSWRHDARLPDPVMCAKLADLSGVPLTRVLGMVGEARAISQDEKAVWRRLASAAAVVLAVFALALGAEPSRAAETTKAADSHHYAQWLARRVARWFSDVGRAFAFLRSQNAWKSPRHVPRAA